MTDPAGGLFGSTGAWMLDDDVVHANHGSFGGITRATHEAVTAARARVAANPMRFFDREYHAAHDRAVAAVAGLVGADVADTTLVANATVGMEVVLRLLPWRSDATIVVTDQGYLSVLRAVQRRAATSRARVEVVSTDPADPDAIGDRVVDAVDRARVHGPVGVVVDQVASATACPLPVVEIVAAASERDVPVVVDGAHVPGQFPPGSAWPTGAAAWTGNLHKWAAAPHSLAVLVVDPAHQDVVGPVVSTWYDDLDWPDNSAWQGTLDPGPLLVAEQVVDQARSILARGDQVERLVVDGATMIAAEVGGSVLPGRGWMRAVELPPAITRSSAVTSFLESTPQAGPLSSPPDLAARGVEAWTWRRGIEAKVTPFADRLLLRLSGHAYTAPRDHERLAGALSDLMAT